MLVLRHAGNPEATRKISLARALFEVANNEGIDAARRWLLHRVLDAIQGGHAIPGPEAVPGWETALALTDGETEAVKRAQVQVNLGQAYRSRNEPGDIDRAIGVLERALEVLTRQSSPQDFSGIHRVLGNVFFSDARLSAESRCTRAIDHYLLALEGLSADRDPQNFLHVNFMLGSCWRT